ncbi:unnamed protein product [Orchesella dallaii]|uniref:Uncharacterized protein n=1 Tax=Orchesella dallaii TaxID=48710 RepID=A0ABP1PP55_9HEXA
MSKVVCILFVALFAVAYAAPQSPSPLKDLDLPPQVEFPQLVLPPLEEFHQSDILPWEEFQFQPLTLELSCLRNLGYEKVESETVPTFIYIRKRNPTGQCVERQAENMSETTTEETLHYRDLEYLENVIFRRFLRIECEELIPEYTEKYDNVTIRATSSPNLLAQNAIVVA